jgi:uncharacterized protein (TIGR02391 family)
LGAFIDDMRNTFGTHQVVIIHDEGGQDEHRTVVEAHIQSKVGMFDVDTPIYEGDVVELDDPRGGRQRRLAAEVEINDAPDSGFESMSPISVTWGKAPAVRSAPIRRLLIENLHRHVTQAASDLFNDQHYGSAVSEAFKSLEVRVRDLSQISDKSGEKLMGAAFGTSSPILDVSMEKGRSGRDEQEGFLALFRGAMLGIRNPKAHELFALEDPQRALEYLGFASLLHRRLDSAEQKLSN